MKFKVNKMSAVFENQFQEVFKYLSIFCTSVNSDGLTLKQITNRSPQRKKQITPDKQSHNKMQTG